MTRIWHLSDLHFEDKAKNAIADNKVGLPAPEIYSAEKGDKFISAVRTAIADKMHPLEAPDAIVVSGDFALHGNLKGLAIAANFLKKLCETTGLAEHQVVVVPGNHDLDLSRFDFEDHRPNHPPALNDFLSYFRVFTSPYSKEPWLQLKELVLFPLDSCGLAGFSPPQRIERIIKLLRDNHVADEVVKIIKPELGREMTQNAGAVRESQLDALEKQLEDRNKFPGCVRVAIMHHHLSPFPIPEFKEFEAVANAGHVKVVLSKLGFRVVLHGHKHYESTTFEQEIARSIEPGLLLVGAPKLFGENGYSVFYQLDLGNDSGAPTVTVKQWGVDIGSAGKAEVRRQVTIAQDASILSRKDAYMKEAFIEREIEDLARDANVIDILALRGVGLFADDGRWFQKAFRSEKRKDWKVRVLLIDTEAESSALSSFLDSRAKAVLESKKTFLANASIALSHLRDCLSIAESENGLGKIQIEVRRYCDVPYWRLIRLDNVLLVTSIPRDSSNKGTSMRMHNQSGFRLRGTEEAFYPEKLIYEGFVRYYEDLWLRSKDRAVDLKTL